MKKHLYAIAVRVDGGYEYGSFTGPDDPEFTKFCDRQLKELSFGWDDSIPAQGRPCKNILDGLVEGPRGYVASRLAQPRIPNPEKW